MMERRGFIATTIAAAATASGVAIVQALGTGRAMNEGGHDMTDKAEDPRITRARLAGPEQVTRDATVAVLGADGTMTVLVKGTNEWVCTPGDENKIGAPPMCMNPMGMRWMMDAMQGKPKPTNTAPGMI
jgi:hypothetical protein